MNLLISLFGNLFMSSLLAFILYMTIFHESKMIRMSYIRNIMKAYEDGEIKEGDGIIINNEMYGKWRGFSDIEKGIAKVEINDSFVIEVLISHLSLLKSK